MTFLLYICVDYHVERKNKVMGDIYFICATKDVKYMAFGSSMDRGVMSNRKWFLMFIII